MFGGVERGDMCGEAEKGEEGRGDAAGMVCLVYAEKGSAPSHFPSTSCRTRGCHTALVTAFPPFSAHLPTPSRVAPPPGACFPSTPTHCPMAKRRAAVDSDDEEPQEEGLTAQKRARFDHHPPEVVAYQPEPEAEPIRPTRSARRRKNNHDDGDDVEQDDEDEDEPLDMIREQNAAEDSAEQARFEEENEERIRESIRARSKLEGVRLRDISYSPSHYSHRAS